MSLHPGVVKTELTRYILTGWKKYISLIFEPILSILLKNPEQGAQTTIMAVFAAPE